MLSFDYIHIFAICVSMIFIHTHIYTHLCVCVCVRVGLSDVVCLVCMYLLSKACRDVSFSFFGAGGKSAARIYVARNDKIMIHKVRLYAEQVPDKGKADERAGKSSKQVGDMLKQCDVVVADTIVCQYPVETHSDTSILDRQAGPIEGDCSINKLAIEARRGHEGATRQCAIHKKTHIHTYTHERIT